MKLRFAFLLGIALLGSCAEPDASSESPIVAPRTLDLGSVFDDALDCAAQLGYLDEGLPMELNLALTAGIFPQVEEDDPSARTRYEAIYGRGGCMLTALENSADELEIALDEQRLSEARERASSDERVLSAEEDFLACFNAEGAEARSFYDARRSYSSARRFEMTRLDAVAAGEDTREPILQAEEEAHRQTRSSFEMCVSSYYNVRATVEREIYEGLDS